MEIHRLLTIAHKEFSDHITGKKFLILILMLGIAVAIGTVDGITDYQNNLDQYKSNVGVYASYSPSPMNIFGNIADTIGYFGFGAVIAIALGFDLISGEKETRSLKSLLSHPLYRDEIINGKAIGGILALVVAAVSIFMLTYAILLLQGIVPNLDETIGIVILWLITILFLAANFSLALMSSVIAKNSSSALIISMIILFAITFLFPVAGAKAACYIALGEEPSQLYIDEQSSMTSEEIEWHEKKAQDYYRNVDTIYSVFRLFSIQNSYLEIKSPLTNPSIYLYSKNRLQNSYYSGESNDVTGSFSIWDALSDVWLNIVSLIMFPIVFFGIAYVKFMRMDLR
ncbi:MAG: ABC transporter permease subunit [Methanomicrobium sp.]|nr:ABC transporter permease subunit [Methanomicrobium sp.]